MDDDRYLRAYFTEMLGTFAFVLVSAGAVVVTPFLPGAALPWWKVTGIAVATGAIYAGMLAVTLPVSGGYLNPAIAIMLWVFKKIDGPRASALVLVQLLGATLAALILRYVLPGQDDILRASRLGAPHLNLDFFNAVALGSILKGAGIELLLTFILTFAVFGLAFDPRIPRSATRLTPLWLGLIVMAITIVGLPLTGAALNPARWFGPAIAETTVMFLRGRAFEDNAVYWIGPIAGSLLAGALYSTLVLPPAAEERPAQTAANAAGGPVGASSTLFRARK